MLLQNYLKVCADFSFTPVIRKHSVRSFHFRKVIFPLFSDSYLEQMAYFRYLRLSSNCWSSYVRVVIIAEENQASTKDARMVQKVENHGPHFFWMVLYIWIYFDDRRIDRKKLRKMTNKCFYKGFDEGDNDEINFVLSFGFIQCEKKTF